MTDKSELGEALRQPGRLMTYLDGEWVPYANLYEFIQAQRDWGYETFGPDYSGTLPHLKKEIKEVEENPDDLEEWIDVVLLGFSGACRSGGGRTAVEVVDALVAKFEKNKARTWPDWREVAAGEAIEHNRTGEESKDHTCFFCKEPIAYASFGALGFWEPDYDPGNDPVIWRHKKTGYSSCRTAPLTRATPTHDRHPHESMTMSVADAGRNVASSYQTGIADGKRNLLLELAALSPGYAAMVEAYEATQTLAARKAHGQIPEI